MRVPLELRTGHANKRLSKKSVRKFRLSNTVQYSADIAYAGPELFSDLSA